ncbi:hypothetical protein VIGAN_05231800 [Vigna angularis var. angularis]|uniref:Uncharacterized protein n=1 Tax=Vigna angularis var. angularis TaxID=157739 RepID=A0A0S3S7B7_PHAAN|nr:hypothetical protein VIGAN_05231800 [Vigna angularis var. angularis]
MDALCLEVRTVCVAAAAVQAGRYFPSCSSSSPMVTPNASSRELLLFFWTVKLFFKVLDGAAAVWLFLRFLSVASSSSTALLDVLLFLPRLLVASHGPWLVIFAAPRTASVFFMQP